MYQLPGVEFTNSNDKSHTDKLIYEAEGTKDFETIIKNSIFVNLVTVA